LEKYATFLKLAPDARWQQSVAFVSNKILEVETRMSRPPTPGMKKWFLEFGLGKVSTNF